MKTIVIACGVGIATSTIVVSKVEKLLAAHRLKAKIIQCTIADIATYVEQADLIITTMKIKNQYAKPIVYGMPLLTGMGVETTKEEILKHLKSNKGMK